jgi:hypothetical protein
LVELLCAKCDELLCLNDSLGLALDEALSIPNVVLETSLRLLDPRVRISYGNVASIVTPYTTLSETPDVPSPTGSVVGGRVGPHQLGVRAILIYLRLHDQGAILDLILRAVKVF